VSPRAAAIDIGTNSVLLAVAERRAGELVALLERSTITRLGAGVDRTRTLDAAASDRTLACLADYRRELDALGVTRLDVVGTSALRDAGGGPELCARAERILGTRPRVLTGAEEAELGFDGACVGLGELGPRTVFDVGGGSTEIVVGDREIAAAISLDIGSVRLFERHVRSDPPASDELAAVDRAIADALERAPGPRGTLVGVAGTVTTLCALERGITSYDAGAVHGARLGRVAVERLASELEKTTVEERRALPGMEPGRADVIVVGARIVLAVMRWAGAAELVVSDRGVRWGLLVRAL
jgi:exopolyphosphatase/guanosine-5'-triphosphate,3'-diphosphate pyrophosphatase